MKCLLSVRTRNYFIQSTPLQRQWDVILTLDYGNTFWSILPSAWSYYSRSSRFAGFSSRFLVWHSVCRFPAKGPILQMTNFRCRHPNIWGSITYDGLRSNPERLDKSQRHRVQQGTDFTFYLYSAHLLATAKHHWTFQDSFSKTTFLHFTASGK